MKRIGISVIPVVIAAAGLFLANTPAYADGNTTIVESHGAWRVGAPATGAGQPVVETEDGRTIDIQNVSGNTYTLKLVANPSVCVASNGGGASARAVLLPCSGSLGVNWIASKGPDHLSCLFQNAHFGGYLSGNNNGTQFVVRGLNAAPGLRQQFGIEPGVIGVCGTS